MKYTRPLAIVCLIISFPTAFLKLPWLPATVMVLCQDYRDLRVPGSDSYIRDREQDVARCWAAIGLYAVGIIALAGLIGIAFGFCRGGRQVLPWCASLAVGVGLPLFDSVRIAPQTDKSYVAMVIYVPLVVAVLSIFALRAVLRGAKNRTMWSSELPSAGAAGGRSP